jgi:hypothetical protein
VHLVSKLVASFSNPTEVDTISAGFFFAPKRKKRPNWGVSCRLHNYEGILKTLSALKNHSEAIFNPKIGTPRGNVSEYRTIVLLKVKHNFAAL